MIWMIIFFIVGFLAATAIFLPILIANDKFYQKTIDWQHKILTDLGDDIDKFKRMLSNN